MPSISRLRGSLNAAWRLRVATKAIHELHRIQGRLALATMCIGGEQGIAVVFERV